MSDSNRLPASEIPIVLKEAHTAPQEKRATPETMDRWFDWLWRSALIILFGVSLLLIVLQLLSGLGTTWKLSTDIADPLIKYFTVAIVVALLFRVGRLLKGKFFGVELEFSNIAPVVDNTNRLAIEVEELKVQLSAISSSLHSSEVTKTSPEAEALSLKPSLPPQTVQNDTQKNRFGGKPEANGYRLDVIFPKGQEQARFVDTTLAVTRIDRQPIPGNVHFFLDSTFPKQEVVVPPEGSTATFRTLVRGGFTVGVWIEGTPTLLELDLSKVPNAPYVVRTF